MIPFTICFRLINIKGISCQQHNQTKLFHLKLENAHMTSVDSQQEMNYNPMETFIAY